ncbi:hypothetical protein D3C76_1514980 [compost metagenome]
MVSNNPNAIVAPYVYSTAFFVPKLFTVDNITIFVGPGVTVTIIQYIKKDVIFIKETPLEVFLSIIHLKIKVI